VPAGTTRLECAARTGPASLSQPLNKLQHHQSAEELRSEIAALRAEVAQLRVRLGSSQAPAGDAYHAMVEAMHEGAAILDGQRIAYCNSRLAAMLGAPPEQLIGRALPEFVAPQARASVAVMLVEASDGASHGEILFTGTDGKFRPLHMSLNMIDSGCGQALCVVLSDRSESVLRELRMASAVYQASSEAMLVTDRENIILSVNPAFTNITGYSAEEAIGNRPCLLSSGRQDRAFYVDMWAAIDSRGHWAGEIWNRKKNGRIYAEWLNINVIRNAADASQRYVALFSDITEKKKSEQLIWVQANFDPLTDLPNRRLFADRLDQGIKRSVRSGNALALLLIDLDAFKDVNDTFGHSAGDALLSETAARIKSCLRASDTVARLGGDEFAVILSEIKDPDQVAGVARALLATLSSTFRLGGDQARITASIGIAVYPADSSDPVTLLKQADQAMYKSKRDGHNRYSYFSAAVDEQADCRAQLVRELNQALTAAQFALHFQPIMELRTGKLIKAEALLRWHHPSRGLLEPPEFISVLEETGLIVEIGDWVIGEALNHCRRWSDMLGRPFKVGVNLSSAQLLAADAGERWESHLLRADLPGAGVVVELREEVLLSDRPHVSHALLQLRDAGIAVAIDDFGTGYSSLPYLNQIAIDYLKIDQSFTRNLAPGSADLALSKAIIAMAHELDMKVIAEGIETGDQHALLLAAGCDYGQGYWFSRPLPALEFEQFLERIGAPDRTGVRRVPSA
jgi:diguanylate cyclase (GGDEF)-like protein/PAS domain S-box-containing protein